MTKLIDSSQFSAHIVVVVLGIFGNITSLAQKVNYIGGFKGFGCSVVRLKTITLLPGKCAEVKYDYSYKLDLIEPCPKDYVASVTVFEGDGCRSREHYQVRNVFEGDKDICNRFIYEVGSARMDCVSTLEMELKAK